MRFFTSQEDLDSGRDTYADVLQKQELRRELEEHYENHDCKNGPESGCVVCVDWLEYQREKTLMETE